MRVSNNVPVIIFSAYQACMPKSFNEGNHEEAKAELRRLNIPYKEVLGCYKGREEKSLVIPESKGKIASVLGKLYNQESLLILDNERGAWFSDVEQSEKTFAGFFVPCSKQVIWGEPDAWTLADGQYYHISKCRLGGHLQR
jgi:hypothetical protein